MKSFDKLWEEFKLENPNTIGGFQEQYKSFEWLYNKLYKGVDLLKEMRHADEEWTYRIGFAKDVDKFLKEIENG